MIFCISAGINDMPHLLFYWYHVLLMPMELHDQKSHIVPHFNHLDVRDAMMPLMVPSGSPDANASANGITWPKRSCCTSFHHLDLGNVIVPEASCDAYASANDITWQRKSCYTSFQLSGQRNSVVLLTMLSASHDARAGASGVIIPKMLCWIISIMMT